MMDSLVENIKIDFERLTPLQRGVKKVLVNPFANWFPSGLMRSILRLAKSELAQANWADPGGWRSMVISYDDNAGSIADRILVGCGTIPTALRNRKRLASAILARLIDRATGEPVRVLGLGAGPGAITMDAMILSDRDSYATFIDLSNDAFDYGRQQAKKLGLDGRIEFIQGDVCDSQWKLQTPPNIVKMIGICEYLSDEQIVSIVSALVKVMSPKAAIVFNSLSKCHGTDRFFRRVFGLNMIHRSPQEIQNLMTQAGISQFSSICEPLGVYHVIIGCVDADKK